MDFYKKWLLKIALLFSFVCALCDTLLTAYYVFAAARVIGYPLAYQGEIVFVWRRIMESYGLLGFILASLLLNLAWRLYVYYLDHYLNRSFGFRWFTLVATGFSVLIAFRHIEAMAISMAYRKAIFSSL